jgi:hypothetical protein
MAAPPPGADVQRRHRPTAAGLAVTEGSLRAPFSARHGETMFPHVPLPLDRGETSFPREPPSSALFVRPPHVASRPAKPASGRDARSAKTR